MSEMSVKKCTKCGEEKDLSLFVIHKQSKDGHSSECKKCHNKRSSKKYFEDLEKSRKKGRETYHRLKALHPKPPKEKKPKKLKSVSAKEYYDKNKDIIKQKKKEYARKNKDKANGYKKKYVENNYEKRLQQSRDYYARNKHKRKEYVEKNRKALNEKKRKYIQDNPQARIAHNLRSRIRNVLKGLSKGGRLASLVGCDMDFLKQYIESYFTEGMTWQNYGLGEGKWSLDHTIPLATFNLENEDEQRIAFHYSNMRPMWYPENASKGSFHNGKHHRKNKS